MAIGKTLLRLVGVIVGFIIYQLAEVVLINGERLYGPFGAFGAFMLAFGILFVILLWLYRRYYRQPFPTTSISTARVLGQGFILLVVIQALAIVVTLKTGSQQAANQTALLDLLGKFPWSIRLLAVIGGPVIEELLFRGLLINSFGPVNSKRAKWLLGVVSALSFGAIHVIGASLDWHFFTYAGLGAVLAWTYLRRGRLQDSIALHVLNNAAAIFI